MGRPIKKSYFGNLNSPYNNFATGGNTGVGGEGFSSLVVTNTATNSGYSTTTNVTWVASTPQLGTGTPASGTATVVYDGVTGRIQTLGISNPGTGYTSTSSVTLTFTPSSGGTAATFVLNLTSSVTNDIAVSAYIPSGTQALPADILKQESSRRYLVGNSEGKGICKLVAASPAAGEMTIIARDSANNQYYVKKLTSRKALLVQKSGSGYEFADNTLAGWNLTAAVTGISVVISNN